MALKKLIVEGYTQYVLITLFLSQNIANSMHKSNPKTLK